MVTLLDRTLPVPIASLVAVSLHRQRSSESGSLGSLQSGQHKQPKQGAAQPHSTRFLTTKTEDAMDSILPCAAEEWFRPVLQQHNKFGNPAKLSFRYSAHG